MLERATIISTEMDIDDYAIGLCRKSGLHLDRTESLPFHFQLRHYKGKVAVIVVVIDNVLSTVCTTQTIRKQRRNKDT